MTAQRDHVVTTAAFVHVELFTNLPPPDALQPIRACEPSSAAQWIIEDIHPAPAAERVQGAENTTVGIAAVVLLHVTVMLETVSGSAEDNTRTPKTLATESKGAATAHQALLPSR